MSEQGIAGRHLAGVSGSDVVASLRTALRDLIRTTKATNKATRAACEAGERAYLDSFTEEEKAYVVSAARAWQKEKAGTGHFQALEFNVFGDVVRGLGLILLHDFLEGMPKQARLFAGNWGHLFGPGRAETQCRIVVDVVNDELKAAQAFDGLKWIDLSKTDKDDLAESLFDANLISEAPQDFGLSPIASLPSWAMPSEIRETGIMKDFDVTFAVSVTAGTPEEAARFALDDLRDKSLESWCVDVEHQGEKCNVTVPGDGGPCALSKGLPEK